MKGSVYTPTPKANSPAPAISLATWMSTPVALAPDPDVEVLVDVLEDEMTVVGASMEEVVFSAPVVDSIKSLVVAGMW